MRSLNLRSGVLALSLPLLAFGQFACVDDESPGGGAILPPECESSPLNCTLLQHEGKTHVPIIGYGNEEKLRVKWTNKTGDPIPNGTVTWTLVPKAGQEVFGTRLEAGTSKTDGLGVAQITIRSGTGDSRFSVMVAAEGAKEIEFTMSVSQKGDGDMVVKVSYTDGVYGPAARAFEKTQILVFDQGTGTGKLDSCTEVFDPYDPLGTLPLPSKLTATLGALPNEETIQALPTGSSYTVLAFGQRVEDGKTIGLAWACWRADKNNPDHLIKPGRPVEVNLALKDLVPRYVGTYTITSEYDFLAVVPDNIEVWVRALGNLFKNPGEQIFKWLANVEAVAGFLETLGPLRVAIEGVLTDIVNGLLENFAPAIVNDIRGGVIDVFDILTSLDVISEMKLDEEPEPATDASRAGVLEFPLCSLGIEGAEGHSDGKCPQTEEWQSIGFDWSNSPICEGRDDEECNGYREYGFEAYGLNVVNAEFNAYTTNFWEFTVEPHPVNLDWGALVLFVVEQIALPMIFDNDVDSLQDLLLILLGGRDCIAGGNDPVTTCCESFADSEALSGARSVALSLCKQGLPVVVTQLRNQLVGQDVNSGDAFVIGTSDAFDSQLVPQGVNVSPCKMYDDDPTDLVVDKIGRKDGGRCSWVGYIDSDSVDPVEATFYGIRD